MDLTKSYRLINIKYVILIIISIISTNVFAQENLNKYKYVVVPNKFKFLKEADRYQLNSLTKFLFEKYGFNVLMDNENFPNEILTDRCMALNANVNEEKGLFKTKLTVILENCSNETVFKSQVGESKEEDYTKAYHNALRDAFESFENINYKYSGRDIKSKPAGKHNETKPTAIEEVPKMAETKNSKILLEKPRDTRSDVTLSQALYAQAIPGGFQLVDNSPQVIYRIKKTSLTDVFLVEGKQAIIFKLNNKWFIESYENNHLIKLDLSIKF
jgi:hypothetical protein